MAWMKRRFWYAPLMMLPTLLGQSNVRAQGSFWPGFLAGLMLVSPIVLLSEIILWIRRLRLRQKNADRPSATDLD